MATPEGDIQAAILDYLSLRRVVAIRLNNQPIFDTTRKIFRKLPKHTPRGLADILVIKDGKAIFLEVKSETGKLSPDQREFGSTAICAGAQYHIVRSIDEVVALQL